MTRLTVHILCSREMLGGNQIDSLPFLELQDSKQKSGSQFTLIAAFGFSAIQMLKVFIFSSRKIPSRSQADGLHFLQSRDFDSTLTGYIFCRRAMRGGNQVDSLHLLQTQDTERKPG